MTALLKTLRRGSTHTRARSLSLLAAIIGRKHGVRVEFRAGHSASTDGKVIYLPMLSADATEDDALLLEGLLDHEAGHCRLTDFDFMALKSTQKELKAKALLFPLFNMIEDVWMEREQAKIYPGCFRNIKRSVEVMIDRNLYGGRVIESNSAADAMRGYLLHGLLARLYENPRLEDFAKSHRGGLVSLVGERLTTAMWETALEVDKVKTTSEAFELARKLLVLIEMERNMKSTPPPQKRLLEQMMQEVPSGGDIATMIEEALTKNGATEMNNPNMPVLGHLRTIRAAEEHLYDIRLPLTELARPVAIRLGTRLESVLEAKTECETSYRRSGRRLGSRKVVGLTLGNLTAFSNREEGDGLDTALCILGDLSGSMFAPMPTEPELNAVLPHAYAKTAMLAVGDVLDRFDVPFMVSAYGETIFDIKTFDDSWRKRKVFLDLHDAGFTMTAEALSHIGVAFAQRQEKRKLALLLTDGNANENSLVIPAMNELARIGVEFAVIFIGDGGKLLEDLIREAGYPVQRVEEASDIAKVTFEAIKNVV